MKIKEEEIKYLSGLLDADGSLSFTFNNGYLHLVLNLELAESIDKDGKYIKNLGNYGGNLYTRKREENWSRTNTWRVCKRNELEMLLPRVIKHMVIKARHWQTLLDMYRKMKAIKIDNYLEYKNLSELSREDVGPLKAKKHPTWAWTAGYLDGDGHFLLRERKNQTELRVGAVCHKSDKLVLAFLQHAFKGIIREDKQGYFRWNRNLGPRDRTFAIKFLKKIHLHSRLKKWKIEQLLSFHYSQRLNNSTSTEEVIV